MSKKVYTLLWILFIVEIIFMVGLLVFDYTKGVREREETATSAVTASADSSTESEVHTSSPETTVETTTETTTIETTSETTTETTIVKEVYEEYEEPVYEEVYEEPSYEEFEEPVYEADYSVLTPSGGVNYFNGRMETYYNLPMGGVLDIMYSLGYSGEYWVRSDGVKMFGDYVMCACDFGEYPRGSIIETSLGTAMVCDTGSGGYGWTDIAVTW